MNFSFKLHKCALAAFKLKVRSQSQDLFKVVYTVVTYIALAMKVVTYIALSMNSYLPIILP